MKEQGVVISTLLVPKAEFLMVKIWNIVDSNFHQDVQEDVKPISTLVSTSDTHNGEGGGESKNYKQYFHLSESNQQIKVQTNYHIPQIVELWKNFYPSKLQNRLLVLLTMTLFI